MYVCACMHTGSICIEICNAASALYTNLQLVDFQKCECALACPVTNWVTWQVYTVIISSPECPEASVKAVAM